MTYEELLSKVPHSLRGKMEHSAELLRKAADHFRDLTKMITEHDMNTNLTAAKAAKKDQ